MIDTDNLYCLSCKSQSELKKMVDYNNIRCNKEFNTNPKEWINMLKYKNIDINKFYSNNFDYNTIIWDKIPTENEKIECKNYVNASFNMNDEHKKEELLKKAILLNPRNTNTLIQLGMFYLSKEDKTHIAYQILEKAFDDDYVEMTIPINSYQGRFIAFILGRYNYQIHKYKTSRKFFYIADKSECIKDDSHKIQLATHISGHPESVKDANRIIKEFNSNIDKLLRKDTIDLSFINNVYKYDMLSIYKSCLLSPFNLEIYYEADFKSCMNKYYKLVTKIFPYLNYTAPNINNNISINCKYKIGIASGFFFHNNSVIADFGGVINRLPRDKFDITFIYIVQNDYNENDFVYKNYKHIIIEPNKDPMWLENARSTISNLDLDLLLYLDSTMAPVVQKILMSKLAKVQACSHGHPVTTGVDSNIMNYYVSWGAAELEYNIAKNHYMEKLILLPNEYMHQYYEYRTKDQVSRIDSISFKNLKRDDFSNYVPKDGNWYTCMQKPFKRHPEFDYMLTSILKKDPNGRLLLHDSENEENLTIMKNRLQKYNIDMNRIHFIPAQPHHRLMGLYKLSDVILDSYHAGGCTTTREALEIGSLVVTLPSKYLGSRWSLAYYNIIGVLDLIAKDKEDYISIAVKMGTNLLERDKVRKSILDNVNKLFHREEAVESWTNVIEEMIHSINIKENIKNTK